ncbi:MAG: hypothetical protein IRY97_07210 [Thermomicrobiaceae bacterium]|nr:hypothetical protein [Thermomicrobiaceae bacterium]
MTGDEPFYLLTTASLVADGDLDLRDEYARAAYRAFFDHPDPLWTQSAPGPGGRLVMPHDVGLSLLLVPPYAAGGALLAKRALALLAALMLACVALAARRLTGRAWPGLLAGAALAVSAPTFVYATQVYPEMPAALVVAALTPLVLAEGRGGLGRGALIAAGLIALPWLGVKYALVGAVVAAFALWRLDRRGRAALLAIALVAGAHYVWFHLATYGGLTPYAVNAIYSGNDTASLVALHVQVWNRLYRLLGLFVDREFGLVRWAPALLLAFPGAAIAIRRWGWRGWYLLAVFGAQFLVAAFFSITMRGWWFPGRMLVAVLPVAGLWLAAALDALRSRWLRAGAGALALATAWTTLALWREAAAGAVTLAVDPFALQAAIFRWPAGLFPLYTGYGLDTWALSALWLALLAGVTIGIGLGWGPRRVRARARVGGMARRLHGEERVQGEHVLVDRGA